MVYPSPPLGDEMGYQVTTVQLYITLDSVMHNNYNIHLNTGVGGTAMASQRILITFHKLVVHIAEASYEQVVIISVYNSCQ